jgi:putative hydrolase of the HAD superfamily
MNMIQAIVYDAVGTLIHVQTAVAVLYADVGRRFGSRLDADEIGRRFHAAFRRQDQIDERAGWRTSEPRERERWRSIVTDVLDDVADPASCFESLFEIFALPNSWTGDPDAADVLAELKRRGYRQALASNFDRRLRSVIEPMPLRPFLEHLVISSEIGWRKPAPEFFAHAAAAMRLQPDAILFVGDDRTNDFDAARRAGMQSVLLEPKGKHLDIAERIGRLGDLLDLV